MLRNVLFQVHWFAGITAGVILGLVGLTGAILSFEHEIQDRLNRSVRSVAPQARVALPAPELLARIQEQFPQRRIQSLQLEPAQPTRAARVTFAANGPDRRAGGPPGRPRGETRYVDPYTGHVNPDPGNRGEKVFRGVMQLHRWLTWGDFGHQAIGKQIVGASTVLCLYFALSGLYLRWPARGSSWRVWLKPNFRLRGRAFLWNLHAVIGTWVLAFYVLMSLTGLQWSYDWYRKGLYALAGVPMPARPGEGGGKPNTRAEHVRPTIDRAWDGFIAETRLEGYGMVTISIPRGPTDPVEMRYLATNAPHERAMSTIALDRASGAVLKHERYDGKSAGGKLVTSIFPLHSGSFFGLPGVVLYCVASLLMPVFTITGWMLYLRRRRAKTAARATDAQLAGAETN